METPKPKEENTKSLRLRIFAGPNGSGKSTIINAVRNTIVNDRAVDFGYYINADDIAKQLREGGCDLKTFGITIDQGLFVDFAKSSGLLNGSFTEKAFIASFDLAGNTVKSRNSKTVEQLAQLIARYLREALLRMGKRFSFETVFSHESNLDIMRRAIEKGYKVYLYFVSTESPEINKYRVKLRVAGGGHDVPENKIESRYHRSLSLLYDAAQIAYQAYFFDNSMDGEPYRLIAHFKVVDGQKVWDESGQDTTQWLERYYLKKEV